jgi:hypothetical protein
MHVLLATSILASILISSSIAAKGSLTRNFSLARVRADDRLRSTASNVR